MTGKGTHAYVAETTTSFHVNHLQAKHIMRVAISVPLRWDPFINGCNFYTIHFTINGANSIIIYPFSLFVVKEAGIPERLPTFYTLPIKLAYSLLSPKLIVS